MGVLSLICVMMSNLKRVLFEMNIVMTLMGAMITHSFRTKQAWKKRVSPRMAYRANIRALHSVYETMSMVALTKSIKKTSAPKLTSEEWKDSCCLGFDLYADTSCVGRHARVEPYVEGKTVQQMDLLLRWTRWKIYQSQMSYM